MTTLERMLIPLGLLVFLARPASSQTPTEHLFAGPAASSTVLELTIIPGMELLKRVYSVADDGTVRRQEIVAGSGKLWREEVRYVSPLEVSSFLELLDEGEVFTYTQSDFRAHFPDGPPHVTDSATVVLKVFDPPRETDATGQRSERMTSMLHPEYYAQRAPAFSPARALADLKRLLDRLFE